MFVYSTFVLFTATMVLFIVGLRAKKKDWGKLKGIVRMGFAGGMKGPLKFGSKKADGSTIDISMSRPSKAAWGGDDEDGDVSRSATPISQTKTDTSLNAFMSMKTDVLKTEKTDVVKADTKPVNDVATINSMLNKYAAY